MCHHCSSIYLILSLSVLMGTSLQYGRDLAVASASDKYLTEGLDTPPQLRDHPSQLTADLTRCGGQATSFHFSRSTSPSSARPALRLLDCQVAGDRECVP